MADSALIGLLLLAGVVAVALLAAAGGLFLLHQRRQGTVRAVFMPGRARGRRAPRR